ncbi:MAG: hypothetical protein O9277_09040 [Magnetospirillum sp.]|nr:hypothetical protein [Magnetospirillum sp.]
MTPLLPILLAGLLGAGPVQAQSALETELARDFLALELAGWRLPDPDIACLEALRLARLEPGSYGASEMSVDPIPVEGAGSHYRILAVEPHPTDRRRRIVRFEWSVREQGRARSLPDRFEFAMNDPTRSDDDARGVAAMMREPDRLVVRRECLGG